MEYNVAVWPWFVHALTVANVANFAHSNFFVQSNSRLLTCPLLNRVLTGMLSSSRHSTTDDKKDKDKDFNEDTRT